MPLSQAKRGTILPAMSDSEAARPRVDLNADAGEAEDSRAEEALLEHVTSVSIACGVHAGGPPVIAHLSEIAAARGIGVGAHPGIPSGRGPAQATPGEVRDLVLQQIEVFRRSSRSPLQHVKLHGTLYHLAREARIAWAVVEAMREHPNVILVAQASSPLLAVAHAEGIPTRSEAFLDRGYTGEGLLIPRGAPNALLCDCDAAAQRALGIVLRGELRTESGAVIRLHAGTLCVHGDSPHALEVASAVRGALEAHQVRVVAMGAS